MANSNQAFGPDKDVDLTVYIYRRPNLRDSNIEFEMYLGKGILISIFDKMEIRPDVTEAFFVFPETWLNIIEQRLLFARLGHYCPNLKKVFIKTHSAYIIQCTPNGCAQIVLDGQIDECSEIGLDGEINLTGKTYLTPVGEILNISKINVL